MSSVSTSCAKPLRDVEVDYEIDQSKCSQCKDKPCINACPIDAIDVDLEDGLVKINDNCFGCILCRNACPYDAIKMETKFEPPIRENVPNINKKLCKACGGCVQACKTGAIHLTSTKSGEAYSEIDEDKCIRCGYCSRACPTDAIKYGEILPKTVKGGKAIIVNQDKCIGCMTCTRVCPSPGSINIATSNKLPYINPAYCARCEECMHACPSTAIKYSSRKRAYSIYSKIKSTDIISEIVSKDLNKLASNVSTIESLLLRIARNLSFEFNDEADENKRVHLNDDINKNLERRVDSHIKISKIESLELPNLFNRVIDSLATKCIACGECLSVCPVNAIELLSPNPITINDNCVYCGKCVEVCKFDAILLYDDYFQLEDGEIYYNRTYIDNPREGTLNLSHDKCQACKVCVNSCPTDSLRLEDDKIFFNEKLCIKCRECESICPVNAIDMDIIY